MEPGGKKGCASCPSSKHIGSQKVLSCLWVRMQPLQAEGLLPGPLPVGQSHPTEDLEGKNLLNFL